VPGVSRPRDVVVFDVDDTLYLERDYVASGFTALEPVVTEVFGVSGFGALAWSRFVHGERGRIFDRTLTELGVAYTACDINELVRRYRAHRPLISLLPDAGVVLDELCALGVGLAVLSDGPRESQAAKVEALGLASYTDVIILTDALGPGYGKPDRRGFQRIAELTGARVFAYVADNPLKDFAGPRQLGWTTVRVRRPGGLHAGRPGGADIDKTVDDLTGIVSVLGARRRWSLER